MSVIPSVDLIVNVTDPEKNGLLVSFDNNIPQTAPLFVRNDSVPINLRFVQPSITSTRSWDDLDLSTADVILALGQYDRTPTSGVFTVTFGANTTSELAYDISASALATALNALASVISAGGVTVSLTTTGVYFIEFVSNGAQTAFSGDGTGLNPASSIVVSTVVPGTSSTPEIQVLQLRANPYASTNTWTSLPVADSIVTEIAPGSVSTQNIQQVELNPAPYAGTFQITVAGGTSTPIAWNATATDVSNALPTGYTVTGGTAGPWQITQTASGTASAYTVNVSGLLVPVGLTGTLNLSTYSMLQAFLGAGDTIGLKMEIQVTPSGGSAFTALQIGVTASKDVINYDTLTPSPTYLYYNATQLVDFADYTISSSVTTTVSLSSGQIFLDNQFDYGTGSGPYTHTIQVDKTNASAGREVALSLNYGTSTNPTTVVKDGIGGSTIATQTSPGSTSTTYMRLAYNGTDWKLRIWS